MTTFKDLAVGDTFSFAAHAGPGESWEKTGPHAARVVNGTETRNVGGDEPVSVLYTAADRPARLREQGLLASPRAQSHYGRGDW